MPGRMLPWRKRPYDRTAVLDAAHRARARGRARQAIQLYRRVLEHDPTDVLALARLAPLLARRKKDSAEALASFRLAAAEHERAGFADRAIALYAQAAEFFPLEAQIWESRARLEEARGRRADARAVLVEGASRLARHRAGHAAAERLLRRALELDGARVDISLALARLLRRERRRAEALAILEGIIGRAVGAERRRVRREMFLLAPSPARAWRWLAGR